MIILIPSFEPDAQLPSLVRELKQANAELQILIVNDGSGPAFEPIFAQAQAAGAAVIGYSNNHGKGQALKTGFGYIVANYPGQHVVCADGDGQHALADILKVAQRVRAQDIIVLGERLFSGQVPLRSSFGNSTTRLFSHLPQEPGCATPRPGCAATRPNCCRGCNPSAGTATSMSSTFSSRPGPGVPPGQRAHRHHLSG